MGDRPPTGWRYAALEEIADVVSGGTPSRSVADYWGGSIPWATPSEVSRASVRYLGSTRESITEAGVGAAGLRILPAGSILVTTRATIGAAARALVPMTTNQGFQNLVPHADTDGAWLFHALEAARPVLHSLAAGSTFREVSRESFRRLRVLVAPPPEQRAIGAILDAIDEAIAQSEKAIAATEALRQALLYELLTRGIPGRHTKWRDVPGLGSVPACWQLTQLGSLLLAIEAGSAPRRLSRAAVNGEWGVLRVGALTWGEYQPGENKALAQGVEPEHDLEVSPGDLLLSRANTPELVGRTVLVRSTPPRLLLSDKTLRLVPDRRRTDEAFLHAVLGMANARAQLSAAASGSSKSMFNISQANIRKVRVPLPPRDEQELIINASEVVRNAQVSQAGAIARLRDGKAALSGALLTGRTRTTTRVSNATHETRLHSV